MDIHEFLRLPHRFRWGGVGGDDCFTFLASWCREVTGIDPAEELRGTYRTRDEAHALMAAYGGEVAFADHHLQKVGAKRVQQPADGDVGVVWMLAGESAADAKMTLVGAIRFGPLWVALGPDGPRGRQADHVGVWRLPQEFKGRS